jgi:hypothetical protein
MEYDFKNLDEMTPKARAIVQSLIDKFKICEEVFFGSSDDTTARCFVAEKIKHIYGDLPYEKLKEKPINADCLDSEIRRWIITRWLACPRTQAVLATVALVATITVFGFIG